jgi:hypothetical protein
VDCLRPCSSWETFPQLRERLRQGCVTAVPGSGRRKANRFEPVDFLTAEKIFDARWAMTVLGEALKNLCQEYTFGGKASTFQALKVFLDTNNSITPPSYEEVPSRLQITTGAVKTRIHRLRKRYTAPLREEVGRTVFRSGRD